MEQRMLLYVTLLSSVFVIIRYYTMGAFWFRYQIAAMSLCALVSFGGLIVGTEVYLWSALVILVLSLFAPALVRKMVETRLGRSSTNFDTLLYRTLRLLTPGPPGRFQTYVYQALKASIHGRTDVAEGLLDEAMTLGPPPEIERAIVAHRLQDLSHGRQWDAIVDFYRGCQEQETHALAPVALLWVARALMEKGRVVEGLETMASAIEQPHGMPLSTLLRLNLIASSALSGDLEALERFLEVDIPDLARLKPLLHPYWRCRCHGVRNEISLARHALEQAFRANDSVGSSLWHTALQERVEDIERLAFEGPSSPWDGVDPAYRRTLARVKTAIAQMDEGSNFLARGKTVVTPYLMATLVVIWVGQELSGGSLNSDVLANAGAFVPRLVLDGQYFRLVSAVFLHAGLLHLSFNVLGLHLFGPAVERRLGGGAFFGFFVLCGVLGNAAGLFPLRDMIGVGASGGVMGILGATMLFLKTGSWSGLEQVRKRYMRDLTILLVVNLVIGHIEAQVFNAAHIGGLVAGVLLALPFASRRVPSWLRSVASRLLVLLGALCFLWALVQTAPRWGRGPAEIDLLRRHIPSTSLSVEFPGHWIVFPENTGLVAATDDGSSILVQVLDEQARAYGDRVILDSLSEVTKREAASTDEVVLVEAPKIFERQGRPICRSILEVRGRTLTDELRVERMSQAIILIRVTAPPERLETRRPLFERVVGSLR